jgi:hypothetical protein
MNICAHRVEYQLLTSYTIKTIRNERRIETDVFTELSFTKGFLSRKKSIDQ